MSPFSSCLFFWVYLFCMLKAHYIYLVEMKIISLLLALLAVVYSPPPPVRYPVRFAYIDEIASWTPAGVLKGMGIPGYATPHQYNYICLAFWLSRGGPFDMVKVWSDPIPHVGTSLGTTKDAVQKAIKKKYNDQNISLLISAFGGTQTPTTWGLNPTTVADSLAAFVLTNNLDGVDIDYEDNTAMDAGKGAPWLITFQARLRLKLPNHTITHAPQAPYFQTSLYTFSGIDRSYLAVHKAVGGGIDFYNVQFYNQGSSSYNTYNSLFIASIGWSNKSAVNQIIASGVPKNKVVVGKPVKSTDAYDSGTVSPTTLGTWFLKAFTDLKWFAGIMYWQYKSDPTGIYIKNASTPLINAYKANPIP